MNFIICIFGTINFFLGLINAVNNKKGMCVNNAAAFGACLYHVLKELV